VDGLASFSYIFIYYFQSTLKEERIKKTKDEKKEEKVETIAKGQKAQTKGNIPKVNISKGPKIGGAGGK